VRNGSFAQTRNAPSQGGEGLTIQLELKVHFRKHVNATN
jgi:hypothetical protein